MPTKNLHHNEMAKKFAMRFAIWTFAEPWGDDSQCDQIGLLVKCREQKKHKYWATLKNVTFSENCCAFWANYWKIGLRLLGRAKNISAKVNQIFGYFMDYFENCYFYGKCL